MLYDYAQSEIAQNSDRIVDQNDSFLLLVPFWAVWPYETLLIAKNKGKTKFSDLDDKEKVDLAKIMKQITTRYDNLFKCNFPYSMGFSIEPHVEDAANLGWQFHAHYFPPLLRSASVKKHMVGYELLAQAQRDITSEKAAENLKKQNNLKHYTLDL